jgi:hypothetical protein
MALCHVQLCLIYCCLYAARTYACTRRLYLCLVPRQADLYLQSRRYLALPRVRRSILLVEIA